MTLADEMRLISQLGRREPPSSIRSHEGSSSRAFGMVQLGPEKGTLTNSGAVELLCRANESKFGLNQVGSRTLCNNKLLQEL